MRISSHCRSFTKVMIKLLYSGKCSNRSLITFMANVAVLEPIFDSRHCCIWPTNSLKFHKIQSAHVLHRIFVNVLSKDLGKGLKKDANFRTCRSCPVAKQVGFSSVSRRYSFIVIKFFFVPYWYNPNARPSVGTSPLKSTSNISIFVISPSARKEPWPYPWNISLPNKKYKS